MILESQAQYRLSPYSYYGLGDIFVNRNGVSQAMGGVAYGLGSYDQINYSNPASYTNQDSNTFILDVSLRGSHIGQKSSSGSNLSRNINLNTISLGFPVLKNWKASFGLLPYSRVGYEFIQERMEAGSLTSYEYSGAGGINQLYFGNAFRFFDRLSIGLNLNYLFGYVGHDKNISFPDDNHAFNVYEQDRHYMDNFQLTYGMQFDQPLNNDWKVSVGAVFENSSKLNTEQQFLVEKELGVLEDTISGTNTSSRQYSLPMHFGAGVVFNKKDQWTIGLDYEQTNWSKDDYPNYNTSRYLRAGMEFIPDRFSIRDYWKRIRYRAGAYAGQSYLDVKGNHLEDKGVTIGLGLPFKYTKTTFSLTYNFGVRGTTNDDLIQETYQRFFLNLTFYDVWFFDRKIE